jgi:hypothetical protein
LICLLDAGGKPELMINIGTEGGGLEERMVIADCGMDKQPFIDCFSAHYPYYGKRRGEEQIK